MVSRRYAFKTYITIPKPPPEPDERKPTRMGDLLFRPTGEANPVGNHDTTVNDVVPLGRAGSVAYHPKSQIGIVLYDLERFRTAAPVVNNAAPEWDSQFESGNPYDPTERSEEQWIDENALTLLVNRYSGTLVRGE
jgi:hypothetical protein